MVIYIHRSEIWSDLCDVSSFLLARFIITRSMSMCGFAWKFPFFFHAILKLIEISIWNLVEQDCRAEERSQFSTYCLFSFLTTQYFLQCISQLWLHSTLSLKYKSFNSSCLSLWGINIFCTVPRLCLNMEIFETIGVLFFEKMFDDLELFSVY